MDISLVILAAGMASRYGAMKQTEGFGPSGETIMDYSIHDALQAGFNKVVFIIRRDFADAFRKNYDEKLQGLAKVEYVYQELSSHVPEDKMPAERIKPWGTGHAILCAADVVKEPFAVINADDFYGKDAFVKAAAFLKGECDAATYAIIGYPLSGTLSDFGSVSRGVCELDDENMLLSIRERTKINRNDGSICFEEDGAIHPLPPDANVSMNFWCFHPSVFGIAARLFSEFLETSSFDIKSEFFIPILADAFIQKEKGRIKVIPTSARWFGVTYKEDAPSVKKSLHELIKQKAYPEQLWANR
jgi:NDP-sugar pyrophosphorylase family protein